MKYLYFLKYNNYANRTVKIENSINDYLGGMGSPNLIKMVEDVKLWNPNDGIMTIYVSPNNVDFSTEPDYLVTSNNGYDIDTRWFVVETVRLHRGQFQCTLRRDVFAEAWNELIGATCNIDRAIAAKYDSIIFNPEPVTVNEIIENEIEIKDKTGCPWIVFYSDETPSSGTVLPAADEYDAIYTGTKAQFEEEFSGYYIGGGGSIKPNFGWKKGDSGDRYDLSLNPRGKVTLTPATPSHVTTLFNRASLNPAVTDSSKALRYSNTTAQAPVAEYYNNILREAGTPEMHTNPELLNLYSTYIGKRIYCTDSNKIYTASVVPSVDKTFYIYGSNDSAFATLASVARESFIKDCTNCYDAIYQWDNRSITYAVFAFQYNIVLSEIIDSTVTYTLPVTTKTQDSPYNIWCLPYGDIEVRYETIVDNPLTPEDEQVTVNTV